MNACSQWIRAFITVVKNKKVGNGDIQTHATIIKSETPTYGRWSSTIAASIAKSVPCQYNGVLAVPDVVVVVGCVTTVEFPPCIRAPVGSGDWVVTGGHVMVTMNFSPFKQLPPTRFLLPSNNCVGFRPAPESAPLIAYTAALGWSALLKLRRRPREDALSDLPTPLHKNGMSSVVPLLLTVPLQSRYWDKLGRKMRFS